MRISDWSSDVCSAEKDAAMTTFREGRTQVLVATTVIEVGVDVPNATVTVVLDADRFGIAQLHQLSGPVRRGAAASVCYPATGRCGAEGDDAARAQGNARRSGDRRVGKARG